MIKSIPSWLLITVLLITAASAQAQQPVKVPRIGYLAAASLSANSARTEAFRQGLRDLGYREGKNIIIELKSAEGKVDRVPALAVELVHLNVDVIVAVGSGDIRAAKQATGTIPIVMVQGGDPVGSGLVASLARPGGNITGLSNLAPELSGKRLELLKEIVPRLSRVAVFVTSTSQDYAQIKKEIALAAGVLGVKVQYLDILSPKDVETAFGAAGKGLADAVLFRVPGTLIRSQRPQIAALAVKSRLPAIHEAATYVEDGGLMSYGARFHFRDPPDYNEGDHPSWGRSEATKRV